MGSPFYVNVARQSNYLLILNNTYCKTHTIIPIKKLNYIQKPHKTRYQ